MSFSLRNAPSEESGSQKIIHCSDGFINRDEERISEANKSDALSVSIVLLVFFPISRKFLEVDKTRVNCLIRSNLLVKPFSHILWYFYLSDNFEFIFYFPIILWWFCYNPCPFANKCFVTDFLIYLLMPDWLAFQLFLLFWKVFPSIPLFLLELKASHLVNV